MRHAFQALVDLFLNPATEAEYLHHRLLGSWIPQQLGDTRILERLKESTAEIAHHFTRSGLSDDGLVGANYLRQSVSSGRGSGASL